MRLIVAAAWAKSRSGPLRELGLEYGRRIQPFCSLETPMYRSEEAALRAAAQTRERTPALLVLLDPRGKSLLSVAFAQWLGRERDTGRQAIFFGVGGADGWSANDRQAADLVLSLGPMTLPHELALVVALEQIYRAFTILAGHPYHSGH